MAEPILTVEHLTKAYGETPVLEDISFAVQPGEVIVVVGPSGCGKSTLLRCLNGLEPTQSGRVRLGSETVAYGGKNLTALRQRIGMVFQSYELFPHLTVLDNILCILFAYVTNRMWVFCSSAKGMAAVREFVSFVTCRLGTLVLDVAVMWLGADLLGPMLIAPERQNLWFLGVKVFSNVLVIVANYVFSKLIIFKKKG